MSETSPARKSQLAAVHMAKKQLALTDDSYRDLLERETGKRSAADLDTSELRLVLSAFGKLGWNREKPRPPRRAGTRRLAQGDQARKIRALWLNLYHLAEVRSPEESAIGAFVQRMTKRAAMDWCTPEQLNRVTEALKAWCERAGVAPPSPAWLLELERLRRLYRCPPADEGFAWNLAVLNAQWARLAEAGALQGEAAEVAQDRWLVKHFARAINVILTPEDLAAAVQRSGDWLRQVKLAKAMEEEPA